MAEEIYVSSVDRPKPQQAAATEPAGSTGLLGWIASTARAMGGACLHLLKSPAGGALILTSVCLALAYKQKKARSSTPPTPPPQQPRLARSMSLAMLQGGDKAMRRFKLIHRASPAELSTAVEDMRRELQQPLLDFVKLYANVGIIELSGKEKEAIELLEAALKKAKEQQACEHTHEVHELELLLVEMYIYKGDYEKALSFQCLKREDVSSADARAPLYRAVIYILMNDKERAKKSYDMFKEVRSVFHGKKFFEESTSMSVQVSNFDEFTEMVEHLKLEIQQAHSAKPTAEGQDRSKRVAEEIKPSSSGEKNLSKK
ncbi:uncharacterized protein LOC121973759 [Zingiber officinale]|uniref:uncharacterized protein LOC121973759 n=1 Tax=Zingiber officinale TaxID=94328 RepID=UPI001C4CA09D|nr:uncharacterized protein LOC121973759 [Zingiber officinale]